MITDTFTKSGFIRNHGIDWDYFLIVIKQSGIWVDLYDRESLSQGMT